MDLLISLFFHFLCHFHWVESAFSKLAKSINYHSSFSFYLAFFEHRVKLLRESENIKTEKDDLREIKL